MSHRVFVYGTLMKGQYNHDRYLRGQKYLGRAVLHGYAMYSLGSYPGIVSEEGEKVLGEVYEVNEKTLRRLDRLEDNGRLYTRRTAEVWIDGGLVSAEVYVFNGRVHEKDRIDFSRQPWGEKSNKNVSG